MKLDKFSTRVDVLSPEFIKELECKAEDVFAYAQVHGGDQVDKAMTRLLALAEYKHFCEMMHRYAEEEELAGSMGVMGM